MGATIMTAHISRILQSVNINRILFSDSMDFIAVQNSPYLETIYTTYLERKIDQTYFTYFAPIWVRVRDRRVLNVFSVGFLVSPSFK